MHITRVSLKYSIDSKNLLQDTIYAKIKKILQNVFMNLDLEKSAYFLNKQFYSFIKYVN